MPIPKNRHLLDGGVCRVEPQINRGCDGCKYREACIRRRKDYSCWRTTGSGVSNLGRREGYFVTANDVWTQPRLHCKKHGTGV